MIEYEVSPTLWKAITDASVSPARRITARIPEPRHRLLDIPIRTYEIQHVDQFTKTASLRDIEGTIAFNVHLPTYKKISDFFKH